MAGNLSTSDMLNYIHTYHYEIFEKMLSLSNGADISPQLVFGVYSRLNRARWLDKMPSALKPGKEGIQSGTCITFEIIYNTTVGKDIDEVRGTVNFGDVVKKDCDYQVVRALKAVTLLGNTKNKKLADVCFNIIKIILQLLAKSEDYFTRKDLCKGLEFEVKGYYEKEILKGIKSVFGYAEPEQIESTEDDE